MRIQGFLLALGLILVGSNLVPSSARAGGCKQENVKKYFKKRDKWCSAEHAKNISAMTNENVFVRKGASSAALSLAKHGDGYYLVLSTVTRAAGDHVVRAEQDALILKFDDGTDMALLTGEDTPSRRAGMTNEGFCGFYDITKEQLESVKSKKVVEISKFFDPEKEKRGPRLEQTEDGRTLYRWPITLEKNQDELAEQAACVLTF